MEGSAACEALGSVATKRWQAACRPGVRQNSVGLIGVWGLEGLHAWVGGRAGKQASEQGGLRGLLTREVGGGDVDVGELEDVDQSDKVVVHQRAEGRFGAVHVHLLRVGVVWRNREGELEVCCGI